MLHQRLKALRSRTTLSVSDVAVRLGVSRASAYNWESEGAKPEPEHLQALLDLYGASDEERLEAWRLRSLPRPAEGQVESAA